mgnify:CR=1 FL=1
MTTSAHQEVGKNHISEPANCCDSAAGNFPPYGFGLSKAEMVRLAGTSATDQAGQGGDIA